jgi:hypothetical protein
MTNRLLVFLAAAAVAGLGCKCSAPSLGPLEDSPPGNLAQVGLVLDQPADGETINAEWVSVTGWVDRTKYAFVSVVGAPVDGFYAPNGHVGIPSVPVAVRADGRFIAPRVPLAVGETKLLVIAMTSHGTAGAQEERKISSTSLSTPATIVVSPEGGEAPLDVRFEPHASTRVDNWQWDYDGDGRLDDEKSIGSHRYDTAGARLVMARSRMDGRWVWAVAPVQVTLPGKVTHQTTQVTAPRAITVVQTWPRSYDFEERMKEQQEAPDTLAFTRYVLVADGDEVKVFDARLNLLRSLTGFRAPQDMAGDPDGGIFVADTGNDRLVHVLPDGQLDPRFGDGGVMPISNPTQVFVTTSGVSPQLVISGLAGGRRFECVRGDCLVRESDDLQADRLVQSQGGWGSNSTLWYFRDGRLRSESSEDAVLSRGTEALAAARDNVDHNQWWVVLYPEGRLVEYFGSLSNSRTTSLGFSATHVAVDIGASLILDGRLTEQEQNQQAAGPNVIYLAGPGRLERRELPRMGAGLW